MYSLQETKKLSLEVLQTIGVARSSGGIVTQSIIDLLVSIDEGELTTDEAVVEIIKQEGLIYSSSGKDL